MSYNTKLTTSRSKAYDQHIGTKILDLMDKLRMDNESNSSRRWIWELMQNAKDVTAKGAKVDIKINLVADAAGNANLIFEHSGNPFTIDNIIYLIEQVSTKERNAKDGEKLRTTGKFGTGFLTTHLLSEIVDVNGVIKEVDEPYKRFNLRLDRSGRDIEPILDAVNESLRTLEDVDLPQEEFTYVEGGFNTKFDYELDADGLDVAKIGIQDLEVSLSFTLIALRDKINEVTVDDDFTYKIKDEVLKFEELTIYTVEIESFSECTTQSYAIINEGNTTVAVPVFVDKKSVVSILPINQSHPRLFCDFPLVGSESFFFPCIINDSTFNPDDPRSGVFLTDKLDGKILHNKDIIETAIKLYYRLLDYASDKNWKDIHYLVDIRVPASKNWLSSFWFETEVLDPIRNRLLVSKIVDTHNGNRIAPMDERGKTNIWFPYSNDADIRMAIFELAKSWIPSKIPLSQNVDFWYGILWKGCSKLTLEVVSNSIQVRTDIETLSGVLEEGITVVDWLNQYFGLINLDKAFVDVINNDGYSVIPNQNGTLSKKSTLFLDDGIEEALKDILAMIDIDFKEMLLMDGIHTGQGLTYYSKGQGDVITAINHALGKKHEKTFKACMQLVSLIPEGLANDDHRIKVYEFAKRIYSGHCPALVRISSNDSDIWLEADKLLIKWMVVEIAKSEKLTELELDLDFDDQFHALTWLNEFISFIVDFEMENLINLRTSPILPNQNGVFMTKDDLFLDDGEADELLKTVAKDLGSDFREELLMKEIYLELSGNRTKGLIDIAEEITRLITPRFSEFPRETETKVIFKELYSWFTKNKIMAEEIFGELFVNKHKLYDDEEIAKNFQKAEEFSELMEQFGIEGIEALKSVLASSSITAHEDEVITRETLVSLGVTSIEEFEEALKDNHIAARFSHTVKPTVEMFLYANDLISRAKENVIAHLQQHVHYNCDDLEELATTVLAGIKKNEVPIHVVVRPSDNGEVLIYYSSEKDTLDYENSELWIDNGRTEPSHLTLGKILKTTGITRIPV